MQTSVNAVKTLILHVNRVPMDEQADSETFIHTSTLIFILATKIFTAMQKHIHTINIYKGTFSQVSVYILYIYVWICL